MTNNGLVEDNPYLFHLMPKAAVCKDCGKTTQHTCPGCEQPCCLDCQYPVMNWRDQELMRCTECKQEVIMDS